MVYDIVHKMENIKIESSWKSSIGNLGYNERCKCLNQKYNPFYWEYKPSQDIFVECKNTTIHSITNRLHNLIITCISDSGLEIFDICENKISFSTTNIYGGFNGILIMDSFMIVRCKTSYIIYNFNTHNHKIFEGSTLYINNNRTVFLFVKYNGVGKNTTYYIITTYNIDDCIEIITREIICICDTDILVYYEKNDKENITNYYNVKTRKIIHQSKYKFCTWHDNTKIIETDKTGNCNLISFINEIVTQVAIKEYKNCKRCLDKFMSEDEICDECKCLLYN